MSRRDDENVEIEVERVIRETERALLVEVEGEEHWVPKSQIHDESECYSAKSGPGTMIVPEWWARQAGLAP